MNTEIPVTDEQVYQPQVGDCVVVSFEEGDDWSHEFIGTINDVMEREDEDDLYIIEDQEGDLWQMEAHKFELQED